MTSTSARNANVTVGNGWPLCNRVRWVIRSTAYQSSQVALAWSGLRRDDPGHPSGVPAWLVESPSNPEPDLPAEADDSESNPPSWLVVAASLREPAPADPAPTKEN